MVLITQVILSLVKIMVFAFPSIENCRNLQGARKGLGNLTAYLGPCTVPNFISSIFYMRNQVPKQRGRV